MWPAVPRVGDLVLLHDDTTGDKRPVLVKTVVNDFGCSLEIEWE